MPDIDLPSLPERGADTHKGACGRVLVFAGSIGMMGAGALASLGALRSGAGLVAWAVPKGQTLTAELLALETIIHPIPETESGAPAVAAREYLDEATREADAGLIGPGLPVAGETGELLRLLIPEIHCPLVVDAGALTAVGKDVNIFTKRKAGTVITPHPGEMGRLTGKTVGDIQKDREGFAKKYAKYARSVVVLKGHGTVVTDGEKVHINETGNPGMATAGAGDVLAGMIAGLLGQGMGPFEAACLAVHLHGLAGDLAVQETGPHSLIARDILNHLPAAFLDYVS